MNKSPLHFTFILLVATVLSTAPSIPHAQAATPEALVGRLPTNASPLPLDRKLADEIVSQGTKALPALERELRLGIRFRELNQLMKADGSRRSAAVQILVRIESERSTELLVRSLEDPPDNYGMRYVTLDALSKRMLSQQQILGLLRHHHPDVVIAGIARTAKEDLTPKLQAALARVFEPATAKEQFLNEYGKPTVSKDGLWNVRFAAAAVLKKDLTAEMRERTRDILKTLKAESTTPTQPDQPARMSYFSIAENRIISSLEKLTALGDTAKQVVAQESMTAKGDYAKVLDMALARLGMSDRVPSVITHLNDASNHAVRVCAAITLRRLHVPSARAALQKALQDPYQRESGSDVGHNNPRVYPVRIVAADALQDLK